jgi:hypothetical protein
MHNDGLEELFKAINYKYHTFLYDLTTVLLNLFPILFLIIGTIGNTLSFIILTSKKMRTNSTFCYLACLSLVDFAVIYTFSLNFILNQYFNIDIQIKSVLLCRVFAFLVYFLPQYSAWILVLVSVDRVFKIIMCSGRLIWSMNPNKFFLFKKCCNQEDEVKVTDPHFSAVLNVENSTDKNVKFAKVSNKSQKRSKQRSFKNTLIKKWNTPKGSIISVLITGVILFLLNFHFFVFQINQYTGVDKINEFKRRLRLMTNEDSVRNFIEGYFRNESQIKIKNIKEYYLRKHYEINPIICSPEHSERYWSFYRNYWVHIDTLTNVFVPSAIMFISCLIICFTIRKSIIKFRRRSRLVYFNVIYEKNIKIYEKNIKNNAVNLQHGSKQNQKRGFSESNRLDIPQVSNYKENSNSNIQNDKNKKRTTLKPPLNNNSNLESLVSIRRYSSVPSNIHLKFQEFKIKTTVIEAKNKEDSLLRNCLNSVFCNSKCFQKSKTRTPLKKPDKIYILIILVAINFLFIILTAPIVLFLSFQTKPIHEIEDANLKIRLRFIKVVCLFLMNANHALNILIYGIINLIFFKFY